ncbi:flagellar hook-length control protein FliK [Petroclostridium sp. X23]|uniref:flagellar hook-length control protein FliK n=1 Tax=Petroclostridium sp. X23 TaxID=3045146 RepID=UPI0024AD295B|nr:flagellar hook-length control protein FliK [Petroclostridium sp. X23]WHH59430.1 flagellar hook-length control protein FliK [Petroclostridium sp. X23]
MRIDGFTGLNQLNVSNTGNLLKNADIGDVLRVQVTGISSKMLSLRMPDGSFISAASLVPLEVNLGDFLDLYIKSKDESQVFVEIVKEEMGQALNTDSIKEKLLSISIPPDSKNVQVGREMSKNEIPLTKENFQNLTRLLNDFNKTTADKLTFLLGNDIPVNSKNLTVLSQLTQQRQVLGQSLQKLVIQLEDMVQTISKNQIEGTQQSDINYKPQVTSDNSATTNDISASKDTGSYTKDGNTKLPIEGMENNRINVTQKQPAVDQQQIISKDGQVLLPVDHKLISSDVDNKAEIKNLLKLIDPAEMENIEKLTKNIFKVIDKTNADLLPEQINGEKNIKEIEQLLKQIESVIKNIDTPEIQQLKHTMSQVEDNLNFLNQINRFYSVVHIPININDYNSTAELYVFKDTKNKKKVDPSNASVFISLDTANLGLVEALINIKNKNIECHFQTDENDTLAFVKNNITPLYSLLDSYGYKLVKVTYKEIAEKTDLLNVKQTQSHINKKYSFDMRV